MPDTTKISILQRFDEILIAKMLEQSKQGDVTLHMRRCYLIPFLCDYLAKENLQIKKECFQILREIRKMCNENRTHFVISTVFILGKLPDSSVLEETVKALEECFVYFCYGGDIFESVVPEIALKQATEFQIETSKKLLERKPITYETGL